MHICISAVGLGLRNPFYAHILTGIRTYGPQLPKTICSPEKKFRQKVALVLAALGTKMLQGLTALGTKMCQGLTALGTKMCLGLTALGTKCA